MSDSNICPLSCNYSLPYNQQRLTCLALHFRTGFSWLIYSILSLKFVDEFEFSILFTNSNNYVYAVTFNTCLTSRFIYIKRPSWAIEYSSGLFELRLETNTLCTYTFLLLDLVNLVADFLKHQNATFLKPALLPKSNVPAYYPDQQMHNIYINNIIYTYIS